MAQSVSVVDKSYDGPWFHLCMPDKKINIDIKIYQPFS